MKYSMCADIMYVGVGKTGPIWPETEGILDAMDFAKKNGLDMIEFFGFEGRDLDRIAAKSRELNMPVLSIVAKGGELLGNRNRYQEFLDGFKETIPAAEKLGVKAVVINCNNADTDVPRQEALELIAKGLKEVAGSAKEAGLEIWLEAISGEYFRSSAEIVSILDAIDEENVKMLFDIYHYQMIEGNICSHLHDYLGKIGHIHGANAPARCELTNGELDYRYILDYLKNGLGYEGTFGLEFFTFTDREQKVADSCSILI